MLSLVVFAYFIPSYYLEVVWLSIGDCKQFSRMKCFTICCSLALCITSVLTGERTSFSIQLWSYNQALKAFIRGLSKIKTRSNAFIDIHRLMIVCSLNLKLCQTL